MEVSNIIRKTLRYLVKRFPIPIICSLLFCFLSMNALRNNQKYGEILSLLWCGFFLFISLKLYAETHQLSWWKHNLFGFAGCCLIWYFFYLPSISLIGFFLLVFIAPFIFRKDANSNLWHFSYHLLGQILLAVLLSVGVFVGILLILFLLKFLLDIQFYDFIYFDIFIVISTVFVPVIYMYGILEIDHLKDKGYPKLLSSIIMYVVFPFLLIYCSILYLYITKIIISWNLPKGQVCYLVGIFGSIMILSYLAIHPVRHSNKVFVFFNHHIFKILFLPLILMLTGIVVRVAEFGITETRYFIIILLVWLFLSSCFTLSNKIQEIPKLILTSLVILLIGGSFGPWSSVELSGYSQMQKLESILKNKHVDLDELSSYPWKLTDHDLYEIETILEYFVSTNKIKQLKQQDGLLRAIEKISKTDKILEPDRKERLKNLIKRWDSLSVKSGLKNDKGA